MDDQVVRASKAFESGAYAEAFSIARDAVSSDPSSEGAHYWGVLAGIYCGNFHGVCDLGMAAVRNGIAGQLVLSTLGVAFWRLNLPDFSLIAYERAHKLDRSDPLIRFGLARACIRTGDLNRAIEISGRTGEHLSVDRSAYFELTHMEEVELGNMAWPFGIYQAGVSAFRREDWNTALHHLSRAFQLFVAEGCARMIDICGEYYCNAKICSANKWGLGEIAAAALPFLPEARWPRVYAGAQYLLEGKTTDGLREIIEAQHFTQQGLGDLLGVNSLALPEARSCSNDGYFFCLSEDSVYNFNTARARAGADQTVLSACDGLYFSKYANLYAGSLNIFGAGCHLHFHVVNPLEDTQSLVRKFGERYINVSISASFENLDRATSNINSIYATRRFEIAYDLSRRTSAKLLLTDVDISFASPVLDFIRKIGDVDVGLMFEGRVLPWFSNPAGIAYFSSSEPARKFLEQVNSYIAHVFKVCRGENIWFVDQNALYVTRHLMGDSVRIANLNTIEPGVFGCYTTEGRDAYTEKRSRELGLID